MRVRQEKEVSCVSLMAGLHGVDLSLRWLVLLRSQVKLCVKVCMCVWVCVCLVSVQDRVNNVGWGGSLLLSELNWCDMAQAMCQVCVFMCVMMCAPVLICVHICLQ